MNSLCYRRKGLFRKIFEGFRVGCKEESRDEKKERGENISRG